MNRLKKKTAQDNSVTDCMRVYTHGVKTIHRGMSFFYGLHKLFRRIHRPSMLMTQTFWD